MRLLGLFLSLSLSLSLLGACTPLPGAPADAGADAPLSLVDGGDDATKPTCEGGADLCVDPIVGRACGPGNYCPCGYFCPAGSCEVADFHPPCDL